MACVILVNLKGKHSLWSSYQFTLQAQEFLLITFYITKVLWTNFVPKVWRVHGAIWKISLFCLGKVFLIVLDYFWLCEIIHCLIFNYSLWGVFPPYWFCWQTDPGLFASACFPPILQLQTNTDGSLIISLLDSSKINDITSSVVFSLCCYCCTGERRSTRYSFTRKIHLQEGPGSGSDD